MSKLLVSVCIITYNHEKYIEEALSGVLMQKVNFDLEIIIADDCSTDGTRQIISKYKEKYPSTIKLIFQEKNVGAAQNWHDLIISPTGKYVAYFEGDDVWTDVNKLQTQVDFLEKNEEYSLCFHNVNLIKNGQSTDELIYNSSRKEKIALVDLFKGDYTQTCSSVFRNSDNFKNIPIEMGHDTVLYMRCLDGGKYAHYINKTMSSYRLHSGGVWSMSPRENQLRSDLAAWEYLCEYYGDNKDVDHIGNRINRINFELAFVSLSNSEFRKFLKQMNVSIKKRYFSIRMFYKMLRKYFLNKEKLKL
ncbi:MAG: glycosyltransferase [Flavobacteriales bacterium]|nr:glycosyltransferase [Flavobacteriales bacterium]